MALKVTLTDRQISCGERKMWRRNQGVRIAALLPNTDGEDAGREDVTLANFMGATVTLNGFSLRDNAGNTFSLSGSIPNNGKLTIVMTQNTMPLDNGGAEVSLRDAQGTAQHTVTHHRGTNL
jgi:hypothetical protein